MLITIIVCAALVGLDQLFKYLAVLYLKPIGTTVLLPNVLGLNYLENDGAAFSMLAGKQTFLIIATGIAILFVAYILLFRRPKVRLEYLSFLLIFSGGLGNWIDRFANQYVVDYIEFLFVPFAVFNFADILVTFGFALFLLSLIQTEIASRKKKKQQPAQEPAEIGDSNA